jgi:WhiB family redox-sensing transcriptional regulator
VALLDRDGIPNGGRPWEDPAEYLTAGEVVELLAGAEEPWMADGLCREYGRRVNWFPERYQTGAEAKAICHRCLVQEQCLSFALAQPASLHGIWGGTSQRERRELRVRPK